MQLGHLRKKKQSLLVISVGNSIPTCLSCSLETKTHNGSSLLHNWLYYGFTSAIALSSYVGKCLLYLRRWACFWKWEMKSWLKNWHSRMCLNGARQKRFSIFLALSKDILFFLVIFHGWYNTIIHLTVLPSRLPFSFVPVVLYASNFFFLCLPSSEW